MLGLALFLSVFVTEVISSVQFPVTFSRTESFRRSDMILLNLRANTDLSDVWRLHLLIWTSVNTTVKLLFPNSFRSSLSISLGELVHDFRLLSNESFFVWSFLFFNGTLHVNYEKLSLTTEICLWPPLFTGPLSIKSNKSKLPKTPMWGTSVLIVTVFVFGGLA